MSQAVYINAKVRVGNVVVTQGALDLDPDEVFEALLRHMCGDWGTVDEEDWNANDESLKFAARILSAYVDRRGEKFWIITEADRSATTILRPEEY